MRSSSSTDSIPASLDVISQVDVGGQTWTLTPDQHGKLIVAMRFSARLVLLDPATNKIERRIKAGLRQPIAVAFTKDMWIVDAFGNSLIGHRCSNELARAICPWRVRLL